MTASHLISGKNGEDIARKFLLAKGYDILDENWRFEKAEIDLIAFFERKLIFIEVKTRSAIGFGQPETFVDKKKQKCYN